MSSHIKSDVTFNVFEGDRAWKRRQRRLPLRFALRHLLVILLLSFLKLINAHEPPRKLNMTFMVISLAFISPKHFARNQAIHARKTLELCGFWVTNQQIRLHLNSRSH